MVTATDDNKSAASGAPLKRSNSAMETIEKFGRGVGDMMMSSPAATIRKASSSNDNNNKQSPTTANNANANANNAPGSGKTHAFNRSRSHSNGDNNIHASPSNDDDDNSYNGYDNANHHNGESNMNMNLLEVLEDDDEDDEEDLRDALPPGEYNAPIKGVGQFDLCGSMYKRRGGLGRNRERNWVMRTFTLYGPILCYHEEPSIEAVTDPSKPRARLNLSKTETIAEMHSKRKPGLPTEELLTINIYDPIIHAKRKWEMCCVSKDQQLVWYRAINGYNGKPPNRKDGASERGGDQDTALSPIQTRPSMLYHMPDLSNEAETPRARSRAADNDVELIAKAAAKAAEIVAEKQAKEKASMGKYTMILTIAVFNTAIYFVRHGSEQTYKMTVFFMNAFALYLAFQNASPNSGKSRRSPKARAAARMKKKRPGADGKTPQNDDNNNSDNKGAGGEQQKSFAKTLPAGGTIPRAPAAENSELERRIRINAPQSAEGIRAYAAAPISSVELQPHSFGNVNATEFNLRVGPNYKKSKQKGPSGPALYDLVSMDFLYADTALKNTADKFRIPTIPGITDACTGHAHIPPMIVINTWLPGEEPTVFGGKNAADSDTYSIPMVFVLSKDTLEQLKDLENASPGVKLLSEWCRRAENESDFRGRFKCMGMIENIENTAVPKFIQGYNGKPALVTKSGTFKRHPNYIEFTINVNGWAFLARKGLHTLIPTFPDFIFNVGFTIEARKDDEMPEVLLGGCRLLNLDPEKAVVDGVDDADI